MQRPTETISIIRPLLPRDRALMHGHGIEAARFEQAVERRVAPAYRAVAACLGSRHGPTHCDRPAAGSGEAAASRVFTRQRHHLASACSVPSNSRRAVERAFQRRAVTEVVAIQCSISSRTTWPMSLQQDPCTSSVGRNPARPSKRLAIRIASPAVLHRRPRTPRQLPDAIAQDEFGPPPR